VKYLRGVILLGCPVEIILLVIIRGSGESSLVNFGPAVLAVAALGLDVIVFIACIVVAVALLRRRCWAAAACYAFAGAILSLLTKWALYS
jgi:hypothetical protein